MVGICGTEYDEILEEVRWLYERWGLFDPLYVAAKIPFISIDAVVRKGAAKLPNWSQGKSPMRGMRHTTSLSSIVLK